MDVKYRHLEILLQEARHFGLKRRQQAQEVIMEIHEVVSGWRAVFVAHNVPQKDAENISRDINHRLKKYTLRHLFEINDNRT